MDMLKHIAEHGLSADGPTFSSRAPSTARSPLHCGRLPRGRTRNAINATIVCPVFLHFQRLTFRFVKISACKTAPVSYTLRKKQLAKKNNHKGRRVARVQGVQDVQNVQAVRAVWVASNDWNIWNIRKQERCLRGEILSRRLQCPSVVQKT